MVAYHKWRKSRHTQRKCRQTRLPCAQRHKATRTQSPHLERRYRSGFDVLRHGFVIEEKTPQLLAVQSVVEGVGKFLLIKQGGGKLVRSPRVKRPSEDASVSKVWQFRTKCNSLHYRGLPTTAREPNPVREATSSGSRDHFIRTHSHLWVTKRYYTYGKFFDLVESDISRNNHIT